MVLLCGVAVVDPGEEVLLLDPSFEAYRGAVMLAGGVPVSATQRSTSLSNTWDLQWCPSACDLQWCLRECLPSLPGCRQTLWS